ncbi:MAG: FadR family transcriptional regulator [Microbacteriaceae bacterium]|nr:MAG: FadR family transcriptional regulator [Microbacteriaceae bacterium]
MSRTDHRIRAPRANELIKRDLMTDQPEKSFDTARTKRNHAAVVAEIGRDIVRGRYQVGDILPREEEFVQKLDVGRGVVREALRVLASKGLVEARPKRGTQVLSATNWQNLDPDILSWREGSTIDRGFLRDLTDLRAMIEPAACVYAAERATDTELQLIGSLARELTHASDNEPAFIEADMQFHRALLQATHNDLLIQVSAAIESGLRLSREVTVSMGHGRRIEEHMRVADAVGARSANKARRAMSALIELSVADIAAVLGEA